MAVRKRKDSKKNSVDTSSPVVAKAVDVTAVTDEPAADKSDLLDATDQIDQKHHRKSNKKWFRKTLPLSQKFVFFIGALLGIVSAWYFAANQELVSLDSLPDVNLDSFADFMEDFKGRLPISILKDATDISKNEQSHLDSTNAFAVGSALFAEGYRAKFPVIMIPGVISTGLESWSVMDTEECSCQTYFRKRLWGSWNMIRAMLLDKECWLKHITLDTETGLDPPGYKIRAAEGLEAADYFITGYWIWNKILENLAALSYDPNMMYSAAYDWRLSFFDLERRDGYFSKLKLLIELNKKKYGHKTVLTSHSMGSQVMFFFVKWVEAEGPLYGNGGKNWVNDYVEAFVDISGSSLGTPKAIVALLSGEMRDTVQLNALAVYGLEKFFSRAERAYFLRTLPGIASMLPKGAEAVWGDLSKAPDDTASINTTYGKFIQFKQTISALSSKNLSVGDSIEFLYSQAPDWFKARVEENYSYGIARTKQELLASETDYRKWTNPLEAPLPYAPDMKIFCLYGIGKETERAYVYQEEKNKDYAKLNVTIAPGFENSVIMGEGDGTVSLLTHTMCHEWKKKNSIFNPAGINVTIVEMLHEPERFDVRGGAKTADHVDILGRSELNEMILKIAAGRTESIKDRYISNLHQYVDDMHLSG
ncbi:Lecithin:cholesterol acyltransferase-domain-containing protein [Lipomyces oligophaga]|uniref:Lecithin:cholesterol acyltransferase-domain-containing protein n=1 Tax=Lipomyces oligophaga TaxID=45792 RepID=UPI0034CE49D2